MEEDAITGVPSSYLVRDGVIDYGKDYEFKMAALLSLRCAVLNNVQNSWVVLNAAQCGALDDLVLCVELKDGTTRTYLVQLKHSANSNDIAAREFKTKKKGDFLLDKYCTTIDSIKQEIDNENSTKSEIINHLRHHQDGMVFLLYTNRDITDECDEFLKDVDKKSAADSRWLLFQLINTGGNISQFNFNKLDLKMKDNLRDIMAERFFLCTCQVHADKIDDLIENAIENIIKPMKPSKVILSKIVQDFVHFIVGWSKGELGGHYPLAKEHIFRVLFDLIVTPYMMKLKNPNKENENISVWKEAIEDKLIVVVEQDDLIVDYLNNFIYEEIEKYCNDPSNMKLWRKHPQRISRKILRVANRTKQIRTCDAYECLWKNGQVPLTLMANSSGELGDLLHVLQVYQHKHAVIILTKNCDHSQVEERPGVFCSAKHLKKEALDNLLAHSIKVNGRVVAEIRNFGLPEDILEKISVKDIIYILTHRLDFIGLLKNTRVVHRFLEREPWRNVEKKLVKFLFEKL